MKSDAVRIDDMHKQTARLGIAGSIFVAILIICAAEAFATVQSPPPGSHRADILSIDTLKTFGPLERGPVEFFHDKHTLALEKTGKDCTACHLKEEKADRLSIKYMRLAETDKTAMMDLYHANCIACHNQMMSEGRETGPVVCAGCHAKQPRATSSWIPIGLNHSLHFRHEKAMEKKTGARALRSIVEDFMLDIMYELPNKKDFDKCIITKDVIEKGDEPIFIKAEKKSA